MAERDDLMARIGRAGARFEPGLGERDVERLIRRAAERQLERRLRRRAVLATGAAAGVVLLAVGVLRLRGGPPAAPATEQRAVAVARRSIPGAPAEPQAATGAPLRLADGSIATPLSADTALSVREDSRSRVLIDLGRGRGRFQVVPDHARPFEVRAGEVGVHVLGTVFTVERVADRVGVTVERGVVRVDWGVGERQLAAGEGGWFPPLQVQAAPGAPPPVGAALSRSGRHPHTADDLLRAADAERVAGRPEAGAQLLRRVLREHRSDARAPLAALTLGRLLMIELGRPREAAATFAEARALAPAGPFAEDALAREVEAWAKAGDAVTARKRARSYLDRYPKGHRADTVKAFGGVE